MRIVEIVKIFLLLIVVVAGSGKNRKKERIERKVSELFSFFEGKTLQKEYEVIKDLFRFLESGLTPVTTSIQTISESEDEIYFDFDKVEHLLALLKHEGLIPVSLFGRVVTDFIGKPPEPDILSKLEQEELVELVYPSASKESWVKITPLGVNMVYIIMTSCWDKVPRRWREVIHRNALVSSTPAIEENLMQKLLFAHRVPLQKDFLSLRNLPNKGFELRTDKKTKEPYLIKGQKFVGRLAVILCRLEASYPETVENWRSDVLRFLLFHTSPRARKHEIEKFNTAYDINFLHYVGGQGLSGCPIGLPVQCATAFKDDPDCLLPTRRLSSEKMGIVITILPFFRPYMSDFLLVCEITVRLDETQKKEVEQEGMVIVQQDKSEILNLLSSVAKELENMNQITGIGLETDWEISAAVGIKSVGEKAALFFESAPLYWYEKGLARLTYRQVRDIISALDAEKTTLEVKQ